MVSCQTPVPRLVQRVAIIIKYERLVDINELIEEHVGEQGRQRNSLPFEYISRELRTDMGYKCSSLTGSYSVLNDTPHPGRGIISMDIFQQNISKTCMNAHLSYARNLIALT